MRKKLNFNKLKIIIIIFYLSFNLKKLAGFNPKGKTPINKVKALLILFCLAYLLLRNIVGDLALRASRIPIKKSIFRKVFYKFFYLESFIFKTALSKKIFEYYHAFYSDTRPFNKLTFVRFNIFFFRSFNFVLIGAYCRFFSLKSCALKFRGTFTEYCRHLLKFKGEFLRKRISVLKLQRPLLFKKNKITLRGYDPYPSLNTFDNIYRGFFEYILKRRILNGTYPSVNTLSLKATFYNFLKMVDALAPFYKGCYHNIYLKKKKENFYITVTNREGEVIFCNSSGKVGLLKKKQKKSMFALGLVIKPAIRNLLKLNILSIKSFFCPLTLHQLFINVKYLFLRLGVTINNIVIFTNKAHNFYSRKLKKQKRI